MLGLATLLSYVLAILPALHLHEGKTDSCKTSSIENHADDSCHNYIYHGIKTRDCENHSHAVADEKDCIACHALANVKKVATFDTHNCTIQFEESNNPVSYFSYFYKSVPTSMYLRGPPVVA